MSFTVQEVAQLLKQAKENEKPYVFFTGAGCSISAGVPSATGLIEEIRSRYPIQVKNIDHAKDQYNYGKYMSVLDKDERRRLLKPHILDNKNINWAHIALACLMQDKYIERVLTFNFDSILSRACNLLGLYPSIYDFATANPRLYHLINDPSIVHLHGQGTGFVQLNTKEETQKHTEHLGDFIAATLNSNPSLFIGYSGNADEFFPLLKEKYSEQHRLIWTGRKESIDDIEADSVKDFLKKNNNLTHYIGSTDADHFLIQLAKELNCFPPELFSNPYKFLNQQLENIQEYPLGDGLDILENLSEYLKEQADKPLNNSLYTAFIHKYPDKDSTLGLSEKAINEIMWAYDKQARLFIHNKNYSEAFELYELALEIQHDHIGCLINRSAAYLLTSYETSNEFYSQKAIDSSSQALAIYPQHTDLIRMYAKSNLELAQKRNDRNLFQIAKLQFERTVDLESEYGIDLDSYAITLGSLANIDNDESLFLKCFSEYEKLIKNNHSNLQNLINYSSDLLNFYHLNPDIKILDIALKNINIILKQEPNNTYNLGCYYSITNNIELAKKNLLHAEQHNTLPKPSFKHLSQDKDLQNIHNESWFIELLERLKAKEESLDKAS